MKKTLYLECYAGISGDMTVAALLDLGADPEKLMMGLKSLNLDGYEVEISRVKKAGIEACDFAVKTDEAHSGHDYDMEYLHGDVGEYEYNHDHVHSHVHRGMKEITEIIQGSQMSENARATAMKIFNIIGEAEAKAHAVPVEEVHFHEVGAIDSIVDVAAAAICLDDLDIGDVIVPVLCEGKGTVRCQHGVMPIPAPATLNIINDYRLNLQITDTFGEFVTPTGAAIAAAIMTSDKLPERFKVEKAGLGAGKRTYEKPSILRAMLISAEKDDTENINNGETVREKTDEVQGDVSDKILKLECNVDDCTGEALGYAMERLFAAGAKDVSYAPVYMKKNRPGWLITVICDPGDRETMEEILFKETTTIGIRCQIFDRTVLSRTSRILRTSLGEVEVKIVGGRAVPEYESVAKIARENHLSFIDAEKAVSRMF